jgi:DNA (cytosine-5)-methyltransferase 1
MTFGSLFSGIGGLDLGLERAGMSCKWQVEIDPWCRRVLAKHWPNVPKFADIKEITGKDLEPVDLIAGGFPCQPVSVAGKRQGEEDTRWLWPEFARIVRHLRPQWMLAENVPGLFTRGFDTVLRELAEIGYDAEWSVVSACAVGAPQMRKRLLILAYPRGIGVPSRVQDTLRTGGEEFELRAWWETEPGVGRMANGLSVGMDRTRHAGLGNAVVPQVAEWIGRRIYDRCGVDRGSGEDAC